MNDELIFTEVPEAGYKIADFNIEWSNTHLVKCSNCGTTIALFREGTHCNCGRVYNSHHGVVVFTCMDNKDAFKVVEI